jgi:hypothetical protein
MQTTFLSLNIKARDHLQDDLLLATDGRIILKWFFEKLDVSSLDPSGLGWVPITGYCEHNNVYSGSINGEEFID